jgi:hypothetical protein
MNAKRGNVEAEARSLARRIVRSQERWTAEWHGVPRAAITHPFLSIVQEQHRRNFDLWHEEDKARAPDATDAQIAAVKRNIDRLNQQRNDLIEKLDDCIRGAVKSREVRVHKNAPWNSETPGCVVDRLSILSLKVLHMREQCERKNVAAGHIQKCRARLAVLRRQHKDLTRALEDLLADIFCGRKQMKLYRQFKMYNDPSMNPAIYGAKKK